MHPSMSRVFQASNNKTASEVAFDLDETPQNINNWSKRGISKSGAIKASNVYKCDIHWILTGESSANIELPKISIHSKLDNNVNLKEKINIEGRGIPVISWVSAGTFTTIDVVLKDTEIEEWLPPNKDCGKNGYGLIVTGVSMSPKFEPNDRIYVNPDYPVNDLKTGDLVVVGRLGETEATFKELIIEGQTKYLRPLNPNWGEQIIKLNSGDRLLGKVVGLYRKI